MPLFYLPIKINYGPGSLNTLGAEAKALGKKAFIVTYPDIRRVGLLDRVTGLLRQSGVEAITFEGVEPNPRVNTIDQATQIARDNKIDFIIGLGGGSAMDTAKSVAIASTGNDSVWSYVNNLDIKLSKPVPPIIQVPTMAGTGSELNPAVVLTNWDTKMKTAFGHPSLFARVAIIDPEITLSVPKKQTAAGGLDIFCHVMEPYVVDLKPNPITDGIRETVMKTTVKYLPLALAQPDNIEYRNYLSIASATALSIAMWGGGVYFTICHGLEHALSGYYDVTHGEGLAALLPAFMKYYYPVAREKFELLGKNVFGRNDAVQAVEDWLHTIGMQFNLKDMGFKPEDALPLAKLAIESKPALITQGPLQLDADKIAQIYLKAAGY